MEDGLKEVDAAEPVVDGEGLRTEVSAAMLTEVPLNPAWADLAFEEAFLLESPRL